jgi:hypothetical protein
MKAAMGTTAITTGLLWVTTVRRPGEAPRPCQQVSGRELRGLSALSAIFSCILLEAPMPFDAPVKTANFP